MRRGGVVELLVLASLFVFGSAVGFWVGGCLGAKAPIRCKERH